MAFPQTAKEKWFPLHLLIVVLVVVVVLVLDVDLALFEEEDQDDLSVHGKPQRSCNRALGP
jgi:hypothetical protein